MKIKQIVLAAAAASLMSGSALAATQADYDSAVKAANAAIAAAKGHEWRDTGKLMKKAAAAAKKGDFDGAVKLAKAAEFQGKAAKQQAAEQAGAGNPGYLYQ